MSLDLVQSISSTELLVQKRSELKKFTVKISLTKLKLSHFQYFLIPQINYRRLYISGKQGITV